MHERLHIQKIPSGALPRKGAGEMSPCTCQPGHDLLPDLFLIKTKSSMIYKILIMIVLMIALAISGIVFIELRANNKLLNMLKIPQPGTNLELIVDQLGSKLLETSNEDEMMFRGSVNDVSFFQGKKLFIFAASLPPARALEVWTDENNIILFVTWQHL